jgi:hypothetical protein
MGEFRKMENGKRKRGWDFVLVGRLGLVQR